MSESISARVGRIISGGLNAIVDSMESAAPDMVMEQVLRELDGAIDEVRAELGRVTAGRHLATSRLADENRRRSELDGQIRTAVAEGRDDLAEAGIAEQLDIEAQIPVLERAIAESGDKEKELEGYIRALQARKRELRAELKRFAESRRGVVVTDTGQTTPASGEGVAARVERAESAFDRMLEKQTGLAASRSGTGAHGAKLAELEELSRKNRVAERLAALKTGTGEG